MSDWGNREPDLVILTDAVLVKKKVAVGELFCEKREAKPTSR